MILLAQLRMAPRDEDDLRWRYTFADGEIKALASVHQTLLNRAAYEPIMRPASLTCGPVYVSTPSGGYHGDRDIDWRSVLAAGRARRIDAALRAIGPDNAGILRLAYGTAPRAALLQLERLYNPKLQDEAEEIELENGDTLIVARTRPVLSNLLELTAETDRAYRRARSAINLRAWLEKLAARFGAGKADEEVVREIGRGAEVLLLRAGREYSAAARRARAAG